MTETDDLRAFIIERVNSGTIPALNLHLVSAHANGAGIQNSHTEAHENHTHEHNGPGTIRNHDRDDHFYDPERVAAIILECLEADTPEGRRAEVEAMLTPADDDVRMEPGDHTHGYDHGQGWDVCTEGVNCSLYPRVYDIVTTRRPDGTYGAGSWSTINSRSDDITRGLLAARGALVFMDIQNEGNGMSRMARDAMAQLSTSIALLYPLIYPETDEDGPQAVVTTPTSNPTSNPQD